MNNLKFRAWDEQKKIMHHDFQCIKSGENGNDWIVFTSDKQKLTDKPRPLENPYFSQQLKVMQWTGINNIYQGDIHYEKITTEEGEVIESYLPVIFENGAFWIDESFHRDGTCLTLLCEYDQPINIVGNIYENKELLIRN